MTRIAHKYTRDRVNAVDSGGDDDDDQDWDEKSQVDDIEEFIVSEPEEDTADEEIIQQGKHASFKELMEKAPQYLRDALGDIYSSWGHSSKITKATTWEDIIGLEEIKRVLAQDLVAPVRDYHLYRGLACAPRSVLLHGPPGSGKTMVARALSHELNGEGTFLHITSGQVMSKWIGEGEKFVEALFWFARNHAPCVIFLDEAESFFPRDQEGAQRDIQITNAFKTQMDGFASTYSCELPPVVLVAATNFPECIDPAILSRMDLKIPFPPANMSRIVSNLLVRECAINNILLPDVRALEDEELMRSVFLDVNGDARAMQARIGQLLRRSIRLGSPKLLL